MSSAPSLPDQHEDPLSNHTRSRFADCHSVASAMLLHRAKRDRRMNMGLQQLVRGLPGIRITGPSSRRVSGLATDSRRVMAEGLFFALPGRRTDGHRYVEEAVERGATVVVCEKDCWVPPKVTLVQVPDIRAAVAQIAARFHRQPQKKLELTGFLGTSGKTVAATLLHHFRKQRQPSGLIGTLSYAVGNRSLPAHRTTPEPVELYALLHQIQDCGLERAILEVSAHGIDQGRVSGLPFGSLALLNLTPEHLDYHGSHAAFCELEAGFIAEQTKHLRHFIAGVDDAHVRELLAGTTFRPGTQLLSFGLSTEAVFRASEVRYSEHDTRFTLHWPEGELKLVSPLIGEFNLQNVLAALAAGYAEGLTVEEMGASLLSFPGVPGRMERLEEGQPFTILTDYMHTEASYEKGLRMVRKLTRGRLLTVFGCGGDRDPRRRPAITRIVAEQSDHAIATADNPRSEELENIFADMREGNEARENLRFIADRRAAIAEVIAEAAPGDTVLIAGKGHERFQEYADCVVPFDDRAVAREILRNREWRNR